MKCLTNITILLFCIIIIASCFSYECKNNNIENQKERKKEITTKNEDFANDNIKKTMSITNQQEEKLRSRINYDDILIQKATSINRVFTETYIATVNYNIMTDENININPGNLAISPDSKKITYTAKIGKKFFAFMNDEISQAYDYITPPFFSQDGSHYVNIYSIKNNNDNLKLRVKIGNKDSNLYDDIFDFIFSPDNNHFAFKAKIDNKYIVVIDWKESRKYDLVTKYNIQFSPDSKHCAYAAKINNKWSLIVDNKKNVEEYDFIQYIYYSSDSKHLAIRANNNGKWFIVLNGNEQRYYDDVSGPIFSQDETFLAYRVKKFNKWGVVINGKEQNFYDGVMPGTPIFTKSNNYTFIAQIQKNNKMRDFVVRDGIEKKKYDSIISKPFYSPNGKRLAYKAVDYTLHKVFMVIDEIEGKKYKKIGDPIFSSNSKRIGYSAKKDNDKDVVVIDNKEGKEYDYITGELIFSPDSKHYAYVVRNENSSFIVFDGEEGCYTNFIASSTLCFSPDSMHFLYAASTNNGFTLMINNQNGEYYEYINGILPPSGSLKITDGHGIKFQGSNKIGYIAQKGKKVFFVEEVFNDIL